MSETYDINGMFLDDDPGTPRMRTWSGHRVNPMNVEVFDIEVTDIAHALARQCRFNGHCGGFISVANHCSRVHDALLDTPYAFWGLMHDAAETYLGDIIRPMKYSGKFDAYFAAEAVAEAAIAVRFGLELPMPRVVKDADTKAAIYELEHMWNFTSSPEDDEREFLLRYYQHRSI